MLKDVHNRLRPLGIADILDETVDIYKSNFVLLVGISAFLYVPLLLLQTASFKQPTIDPYKPDYAAALGSLAVMLLVLFVYSLAGWVVTGALTVGISDRYLGRHTSIGACYRRILAPSVLFPFLASSLLSHAAMAAAFVLWGVVIGLGAYLAIALGLWHGLNGMIGGLLIVGLFGLLALPIPIYVSLRFILVAPAIVVEMRGVTGSLGRSWSLMKNSVLRAFGLFFLVMLVIWLVQMIAMAPFGMSAFKSMMSGAAPSTPTTILSTIIQTILSTLLLPVTSIVTILLYYDQRIRKEGFDLELLAWELDAATRDSASQASSLPQEQTPPAQYSDEPGLPGGGRS